MLLTHVLTGFGLAGAAGLNAYIPLLAVSLLARFEVISLSSPFDVLVNPWVTGALVVLVVLEFIVDKVPGADHVNDVIATFIRPAAGAVVFAGASGVVKDVSPIILVIAGLVTALSVHAVKAAARPVVNAATVGVGAPVASVVEDALSAVTSLVAVFLPLLVLVLFVAGLIGAVLVVRELKNRANRPAAAPALP